MSQYKILADENIPNVESLFAGFGQVRLINGRHINAEAVNDIDVLLVRSITRVNEALLENSPVKFVGSATIGCDHIDLDHLQQAGIAFANAPGSNANSVAEYVLCAMLALSERYRFKPDEKTLGIVGYGNVGKRVKTIMQAIGVKCLIYDPPLQALSGSNGITWSSFDDILDTDIITLHVPLSDQGLYPTYHMINAEILKRLSDHAILINTSRGAVIDNHALKQSLSQRPRPCVLDVWENEPTIDAELLNLIDIATPHIAGYSVEGKRNGTIALHKALCEFCRCPNSVQSLANDDVITLTLDQTDQWSALKQVVFTAYDIVDDDRLLKQVLRKPLEIGSYFDGLRKNYRSRREFSVYQVSSQDELLLNVLFEVGFKNQGPI